MLKINKLFFLLPTQQNVNTKIKAFNALNQMSVQLWTGSRKIALNIDRCKLMAFVNNKQNKPSLFELGFRHTLWFKFVGVLLIAN